MAAQPGEVPADLDLGLNFDADEEPVDDSFWAKGIYYVYDYTEGDFVPANPQPDPPGAYVLTPVGLVVPA